MAALSKRGIDELGLSAIVPAAPLGRAKRLAFQGGEVLRLPLGDEAIAKRLLDLGRERIGGIVEGGLDDEGIWLVRRLEGPTLAATLRERRGPWPAEEAVRVAMDIASALAACARTGLFPGPLAPDGIRLGASLVVIATPLVAELCGAPRGAAENSTSWLPPEQANGAPWDEAANRYVLGLLLYRMLSGEPAFGKGLRAALAESATREAAPFARELAETLPPGLQGLTLRLLAPRAEDRPKDTRALVTELGRFAGGASARLAALDSIGMTNTPRDPTAIVARADERRFTTEARRHGEFFDFSPCLRASMVKLLGKLRRGSPIGLGVGLAVLALSLIAKAPARSAPPTVASREPLVAAETTAESCAKCHPRQAAEWSRSVMAHAAKSPLFNALESLIEEQVGRDQACPNGAGILRKVDASRACRDEKSGLVVTGSGGEHWCVNCHSPMEKVEGAGLPAWDGRATGDAKSRLPARDLLGARGIEGISCGFCHAVGGSVAAHVAGASRRYEGNASWVSFTTGREFVARPEDARGLFGIGNSGYRIDEGELVAGRQSNSILAGDAHARPDEAARSYLGKSEFCGACHDVRLFGTDTIGARRGEHFKRLRNAYSEWAAWAKDEEKQGRRAASCQDCHMSRFPGTCEPGDDESLARDARFDTNAKSRSSDVCPQGTHFVAQEPGSFARGSSATSSNAESEITSHYFSGVDVPLGRDFDEALVDEPTIDARGTPLSARRRRDLLLRRALRFSLGEARLSGDELEVPIEVENVGAGHRVPAGFSQEREIWVRLIVKDARGAVVYEVGNVARGDEDLHDKVFERVSTNPDVLDARGRPEGLFGADVRDGPDVPAWSPKPGTLGAKSFRGKGLVNFQNGFFRCVKCIGVVTRDGRCEASPGQELHRADRFADGDYDQDTGACTSNLASEEALFETYMPVGALDARRGGAKGPDAILDTRSLAPNTPLRFTYALSTRGRRGPFSVEASLLFRAFPPFLVRAFAAYEREEARRGKRPSGPLVTEQALERLEVVEIARATTAVGK